MLATTHLIASLLLIQLMSLDKNDAFVALLFGVFIDVDHFFGLKGYVAENGVSGLFHLEDLMHPEGQWKSLLHSPMAAIVVGQVSVASRLAIPFLFWGVHLLMDYVQDSFLGLFSTAEMIFCAASLSVLMWIRYSSFVEAFPAGSFVDYLGSEAEFLRKMVGRGSRSLPHRVRGVPHE